MANDQRGPFVIDVSVSWHQCLTNFVVRQRDESGLHLGPRSANENVQPLQYFVDGVEVPRDDFRAVMELVTLVSRSRLTAM